MHQGRGMPSRGGGFEGRDQNSGYYRNDEQPQFRSSYYNAPNFDGGFNAPQPFPSEFAERSFGVPQQSSRDFGSYQFDSQPRSRGFGETSQRGFASNPYGNFNGRTDSSFGGRNDSSRFGGVHQREREVRSGSYCEPSRRNESYGLMAGKNLRPVDWKDTQLQELKKDIYIELPEVTKRTKAEVDTWLQSNEVTLQGNGIPRPVFEFKEAGYPQKIVDLLYRKYQHPSVIQSISWPVALSGRDMISIAKTGSGKTLGFLLPAIMHTLRQPTRQRGEGPSVLIILPTRELAQQVYDVAKEYGTAMGLSCACCYGGASKGPQTDTLRGGVDICIGTPGRLMDFMQVGIIPMRRCSFLVLDEADRMLDMGFEPQMRKIVSQIRPDRQTLMFSATWPVSVRTLARDFHTDPVFLNVGSLELAANHNIQQVVEVVEDYAKRDRLLKILEMLLRKDMEKSKILVFVETKRKADDLTRDLRNSGWPVMCIHGDKTQTERDWVLNEFKSGRVPIVFATDVASRGLDVHDIKAVVNVDYPKNSEEYVHRIGRTGRCEKKGVAYTFFSAKDAPKANDLIKVLEEANQQVPDGLRNMASGGRFVSKRPAGDFGSSHTIPLKQYRPENSHFGNSGPQMYPNY